MKSSTTYLRFFVFVLFIKMSWNVSAQFPSQNIAEYLQNEDLNTPNISCKVYPNPTKDYLYFEEDCQIEQVKFRLYNSVGHLVLQTEIAKKEKIDLIEFPKGIYYLLTFGSNNLKTYQTVEIIKTD